MIAAQRLCQSLHVSGGETKDSEGRWPAETISQIEAYKNVDWLQRPLPSLHRPHSPAGNQGYGPTEKWLRPASPYLGTMSNGLATTGVDGLEVIIAEAGISSWLQLLPRKRPYHKSWRLSRRGFWILWPNWPTPAIWGLVTTCAKQRRLSRSLEQQRKDLDRQTGDYNQFWYDRNYLLHADKVKAEVVFTHGSQDWNVKPLHVYNMFEPYRPTSKAYFLP